jgi:MFS family permease
MASQWARISDRIGRKPTLLIGSVGAMISATFFGFSNSLPMAMAARTCAGLLNPNLGVVRTFVGELVRKDQQGRTAISEFKQLGVLMILFFQYVAKGFSVVPFLRGFGYAFQTILASLAYTHVQNNHRTSGWRLFGRACQEISVYVRSEYDLGAVPLPLAKSRCCDIPPGQLCLRFPGFRGSSSPISRPD